MPGDVTNDSDVQITAPHWGIAVATTEPEVLDTHESDGLKYCVYDRVDIVHVVTEQGHRTENADRNDTQQHRILRGRWAVLQPQQPQ